MVFHDAVKSFSNTKSGDWEINHPSHPPNPFLITCTLPLIEYDPFWFISYYAVTINILPFPSGFQLRLCNIHHGTSSHAAEQDGFWQPWFHGQRKAPATMIQFFISVGNESQKHKRCLAKKYASCYGKVIFLSNIYSPVSTVHNHNRNGQLFLLSGIRWKRYISLFRDSVTTKSFPVCLFRATNLRYGSAQMKVK